MVDELAALNIHKPVVPGIMPISNLGQVTRMAHMSGADVPAWVVERVAKAGDDLDEAERIGVDLATELSAQLLDAGAPGLHFYTLNRSWATREIIRNLGLRNPADLTYGRVMRAYEQLYINGQWVPSTGTGTLSVTDSATEEVIATIPDGSVADVDAAVAAAKAAFPAWNALAKEDRAAYLMKIHAGLEARTDEIAETIAKEVGMPLWLSSMIQVGLPKGNFKGAADLLGSYQFEEQVGNSLVVREAIGVVGCITPWNYPLHQIALKVAPALAAGNTVVLKPSEVAPINAFILAEIIHDAGVPAGVFNLVTGVGPVVGEAIAAHPDIDMVSFTGSTRAGKRVAEVASQTVKRVALELGGKSANVILADADFGKAVSDGVGKCFLNSGQTCTALTRMLVPRERLAEAEQIAAATAAAAFQPGNPFEAGRFLGPLVSAAQRDRVQGFIQKGIDEGATLVTGGAEHARGASHGLLRAAHGVQRRHPRHDHRPGGDLRAGAVDHAVRLRGRGRRDRQRHHLRPRRRCVERRCRPCQGRGPSYPRRPGGGERWCVQPVGPVRRLQAERPRSRGRHLRPRGVPRSEGAAALIAAAGMTLAGQETGRYWTLNGTCSTDSSATEHHTHPVMRNQISRVPYLPGLDGLRAIAVVGVMVYHANHAVAHRAGSWAWRCSSSSPATSSRCCWSPRRSAPAR